MASNRIEVPPARPNGMPAILRSMKPGEARKFPIARRNAAWIAANRTGLKIVTRASSTGRSFFLWRV